MPVVERKKSESLVVTLTDEEIHAAVATAMSKVAKVKVEPTQVEIHVDDADRLSAHASITKERTPKPKKAAVAAE